MGGGGQAARERRGSSQWSTRIGGITVLNLDPPGPMSGGFLLPRTIRNGLVRETIYAARLQYMQYNRQLYFLVSIDAIFNTIDGG